MNRKKFVMLTVSGLMALSCSVAVASAPAQDLVPIPKRTFLLGLSHHPAHRPGETPQDVQQAMAEAVVLAAQNSAVFSVWTLQKWHEEWDGYYAKPSVERRKAYFDLLTEHHHLRPIFNVNFWTIVPKLGRGLVLELVVPPDLPASVTLADREWRRRWLEHVAQVTREFQPAYFSLGNEIDSFYHYDERKKQDFKNYVSLVAESYDAIKQVAPRTKVMVIFRYEEMVAKRGFDLITKFNPAKLDLYGFTTYPDLQKFARPADIPPHYYQPIRERVGNKPVAFTEIGWATQPGDSDGEQNQVDFLRWFLNETRDLNLEMVYWTLLHDLAPAEKKAARSSYLGLIDYFGRPKKAWGFWQELVHLPLQ
jgi:hypothetical protein